MAGIVVPFVSESRQGRQDFSFVPPGLDDLFDECPSHKWLGYFHGDKKIVQLKPERKMLDSVL